MWEQAKQALVESTVRFLTRFASLLPGLAALMVALFLSAILAWILAIIVRRLLVSLDFDERLRRWGFASLAEWSPMNSPTRLVSRSIASLVVMTGFLARSVLVRAVNLNLHYARFLSVGVKWLVIVLAVAMALDQLRIARGIVELAFGILFGGIVLGLALAVGLGSKEFVSKSLERDAKKAPSESVEEDPLLHL